MIIGFGGGALAQDPVPPTESLKDAFPAQKHYSPYAGRNFPTQVFWGDTHLHTGMSMDAGAFGARLSPEDAYRFARGEELTSSTGLQVKLGRPLDFLVVADHSDNMGFFPRLYAGDPEMLADPTGKRWYQMIQEGGQEAVKVAVEIIIAFSQNSFPPALESRPGTPAYRSAWEETIEAAEMYNDPGRFTAFIGYEWTSNTGGNNLHRVVVYRDDGDRAGVMEPYTTLKPEGSDNPRDLWRWMEGYQDRTGGRLLAIAHNGNLSNGIMFPVVESFTGTPVDLEYAETRARWEPLYEATQIKGDGEAHPFLSPNDEFADYETWDQGNLDRIQIVKGWLDGSGQTQEKIYDVAVSDDRKINADGRCTTPVGDTVDVASATWTNTIGDPELITVWTDPDFDPEVRAVYYARVLEIPTPRWTAYEAERFGVTMLPEVPMTTQERAYTSPIWYTP
jgi:hypothetical protein